MRTIRNGITRILNGLAGISFLAMVVLTCWQVFTRYILQNPSTWSEELVGYLFAWMSLFGVCIVTRERGHMNIPILVDKLVLAKSLHSYSRQSFLYSEDIRS